MESKFQLMPQRHYPFEYGGPKRLSILWERNFQDIKILLDKKEIGAYPTKASFPTPFRYKSDLDNEITIYLASNWKLFLNNKPLPGAPNDPIHRVRHGYLSLYGYGLLHIFVGSIIYGLTRIEEIAVLSNLSILAGITFLVLGVLLQRGNRWGLLIGVLAIALHFLFLLTPWNKPEVLVGGKGFAAAFLDVFLIVMLLRAYPHLKKYNLLKSNKE